MPKLKVLFIFNNCDWKTVEEKVAAVKKFYAPKVELLCDIRYTHYTDIPYEKVQGLSGVYNEPDKVVTTETIQEEWYDLHITSMAIGYDIVQFCISEADKKGHLTSVGIRGDNSQGPVQTTMFGGNEDYHAYQTINGIMIDLGNSFVVSSCHEISHAIYMLLGQNPDNTHKYFYGATPSKVFEDWNFNTPRFTDKDSKIQALIAYIKQLIGIYQKQLEDLQSQQIPAPTGDKLDLFCKAIKNHEGWFMPGPQYPKGSVSFRNKNPGNLRYAEQKGSIGKDSNNFAIFPTEEVGFAALRHQVEIACNGKSKVFKPTDTILQFFQKYAPASDNNEPYIYADNVAKAVGVPITTQMKDLLA